VHATPARNLPTEPFTQEDQNMADTPPDVPSQNEPPRPPQAQPAQPVIVTAPEAKKPSALKRMAMGFLALVFLVSLVLNVYLAVFLGLQMAGPLEKQTYLPGEDETVVAMYKVSGVIDDEAASWFETFYRDVVNDEKVKAIVLRVNSPGGGVGASDRMYARVKDLQEAGKPVVVSMGTVAASGGYYIAAPADAIYAEHTTTTGSIGVIAGWMIFSGTLEKLGIEPVVMKSDNARAWKDQLSPLSKPSDRQREHLQMVLNDVQDRFESVVKAGRGEKINVKTHTYPLEVTRDGNAVTIQYTETEPYNGKVYIGDKAQAIGLVDEIGYIDAAIDKARQLSGAKKASVVIYQQRKGLLDQMMGGPAVSAQGMGREIIQELRTPKIQLIWRVE
jgi:protease IV